MFLSPAGDTVFYRRRVDGRDTLFAFQPDSPGVTVHANLASSASQLRAWPTATGQIVVCNDWPRARGGLRLKFYDAARVAELLQRDADRLHLELGGAPELRDFSAEPRALPAEVYDLLDGGRVLVPGMSPAGDMPALYVADGATADYRLLELDFLEPGTLPGNLYTGPLGRYWLTVGDSNHLLVLDGRSLELTGDIVWPVEQKALARVAFHPARDEAWVSAHASVFVYRTSSLELIAEIAVETEPRWHRGERTLGMIGAVAFSRDGESALVARPMSGDLLEIDVSSHKQTARIPVTLDPLEILHAPATGRVYMQSLRNSNIGWLPYR